jgi:hypothetical protein
MVVRFLGCSPPLLLRAACVCAWLLWQSSAGSQASAPISDRSVKAAFLYKFAGYVQWPDDAAASDATLTIGLLADGDFEREVSALTADREVAGRHIAVQPLRAGDSLDGIDVLFIGASEGEDGARTLAAARSRPILTVTEVPNAIAAGSIINFTVDRQRVRFEISQYNAERGGLKLNARLLAVAARVYKGTR